MKPFKMVTWGCDTARAVRFYDTREEVEWLLEDLKESHLHVEVWRWDEELGGRVDALRVGWGESRDAGLPQ
jgi:hypothetical protein